MENNLPTYKEELQLKIIQLLNTLENLDLLTDLYKDNKIGTTEEPFIEEKLLLISNSTTKILAEINNLVCDKQLVTYNLINK